MLAYEVVKRSQLKGPFVIMRNELYIVPTDRNTCFVCVCLLPVVPMPRYMNLSRANDSHTPNFTDFAACKVSKVNRICTALINTNETNLTTAILVKNMPTLVLDITLAYIGRFS